MIRFLSPEALWLLLLAPAAVVVYVLLLRRRRRAALRYATLAPLKEALGAGPGLRRHLPPALLLAGIALALLAAARPTTTITLLSDQRTLIMAIDVSLSMRAADIEPTRIVAAQTAAKAFVEKQPDDTRIGIVTFAGTAQLVQPPTRDREALVAAIDRFALQRHTAIGSGLLVSLAALFPDEGIDVEKAVLGGTSTRERARGAPADGKAPLRKAEPKEPLPPGAYKSGAIILLTDGRRTTGPDPMEIAQMAAARGVRVYTVGFGKAGGAPAEVDGYTMFMAFDEPALRAIAGVTQGEYFHAPSAEDLARIYGEITTRFTLERQQTEVTALAAAAAALLVLAAGTLSLRWHGRFL